MREYKNEDIIVYWHPEMCAHPGVCTKTLPKVFSVTRRPWVNVDLAKPEEIIKCIDKCPSGALSYSLPEGSKVDPALARGAGAIDSMKNAVCKTTIKATKSGPLYVEGPTEILSHDGTSIYAGSRIALCTCGRSKNLPFCDGKHSGKE